MQKKIIALAIAAAFSAPAFADVTPYGIVDGAVVSISGNGQKSDLLGYSGGLSTSRFGVKATEDLGSGLTGVAVLEYGLDTETNATIGAARQHLLGVAGSFGTVATGFLQTTGYDFGGKFDPMAGSAVSPLQAVNKRDFYIGSVANAARAQRALAYISPDYSGFKFAVNYSTALAGLGDLTVADTANGTKTAAYLVSANYDNGPLSVGAVMLGTSTTVPAAATVSEYSLGGSYDLGVAKLLATYQSNKVSTASSASTAYSLSGVVPVGGDAVAVSYAADKLAVADKGATAYALAYLHTMSKQTTLYAAYEGVKNGAATNLYSVGNNAIAGGTLTVGGSSSLLAVGLRKKF